MYVSGVEYAKRQQGDPVRDAADQQAAEQSVDRLPTPAEETGATDDRGGNRIQDQLPGIRRVGAVLPVEE